MHPTCQMLGETFIPVQEVEHIVKQANDLSAGLRLSGALKVFGNEQIAEESGMRFFGYW